MTILLRLLDWLLIARGELHQGDWVGENGSR